MIELIKDMHKMDPWIAYSFTASLMCLTVSVVLFAVSIGMQL